ncbi:MAG: magnesium transporter [Candidatus Bathyarchaeia archaeon]|jgi:magnesium transporter
MITAFPKVDIGTQIAAIERMLEQNAAGFKTIDYIYVVKDIDCLVGVASIKEIHTAKKDVVIDEVMQTKLVYVHPSTDQERMVYLALSNGIKAIPVLDRQKRLLGIVPYDVILQIFNEEVREDTFKFGGIFHRVGKEYSTIEASVYTMVRLRIPWLIIGVIGGTVTASIISGFEHVLSTLLALAAFAPVLAYMSDAVGTQSETLAVRSIAIDPQLSLKRYILRELSVAAALALVCGGLLSAVALVGWQDPILGLIVGLSMFLSILCAVLISTGFPFIFKKINLDPAIASGPFATMISDVVTVTIYFTVATLLLLNFGRI